MTFKRKFRVYLILRNRPKFAKFAKIYVHAKISTLKVYQTRKLSSANNYKATDMPPLRNIKAIATRKIRF